MKRITLMFLSLFIAFGAFAQFLSLCFGKTDDFVLTAKNAPILFRVSKKPSIVKTEFLMIDGLLYFS